MIPVGGLDGPVAALGRAIGLLTDGDSGLVLVDEWFTHPWAHMTTMLSDDGQRAGLIEAIDALLPAGSAGDPGADARTSRHPLLGNGGLGQVYLVLERETPAPAAPVTLAVEGGTNVRAGIPTVTARVDVVRADAAGLTSLAATAANPVRVGTTIALDGGAALTAAALLVAPPDESASRLSFELTGLTGPQGPLPPQRFDLGEGGAKLAVTLLRLVLGALDTDPASPLKLVAAHLPTVLGLDGTLPPLDLAQLAQDPAALRGWLAQLASGEDLRTWLEAVGGLLGATIPDAGAPGGPVLLRLLHDEALHLTVDLSVEVRPAAADQPVALVWGVQVALSGTGLDAVLLLDASVLTLPLTGDRPASVLDALDLRLTSPAGPGRLHPPAGVTDPDISVGRLQAGVRWRRDEEVVTPHMELDDVTVRIGGRTSTFPRLDLTDAATLTAAADQLLSTAIEAGLGAGAAAAESLGVLLGLGTTPGLDLGAFAGAPTAALSGYYRALAAAPSGWTPVLAAVARLLGTATPKVQGTGTEADPWRVSLDAFAAPAGSTVGLQLLLWAGGTPVDTLHLGIGLAGAAAGWQAGCRLEILRAALTCQAASSAWLPAAHAAVHLVPPTLPGADVAVSTSGVDATVDWGAGQALRASVALHDLSLATDAGTLALGTLQLPHSGPADAPDLGLGLDPALLWSACRVLLPRVAESWAGPAAAALLTLLGISGDTADGPPPLMPPNQADLRSLLSAPLAALQTWAARLLRDAAATAPDGTPFIRDLLDLAQTVLTDRLPVLAFQDLTAPDMPTSGAGTPGLPWVVPLHAAGEPALEALAWLEPGGPPAEWATGPLSTLAEDDGLPDGGTLLAAIDASVADQPDLDAVLASLDRETAGPGLDALDAWLRLGDGVVAYESVAGAPEGWRVGEPVDAAHDALAAHPDIAAQIAAEIADRTAGRGTGSWRVLLLAPPVPGATCWATLLSEVPIADIGVFSLRATGVPPDQVDLGGLPATPYLVADTGDDGDQAAGTAVAALSRLVDALAAQPGAPAVLLVAASYLGPVATQVAATHSDLLGLITVGGPTTTESPLTDAWFADAVRLGAVLAGDAGSDSATLAALDLLAGSLDATSTAAGQIPVAALARFEAPTTWGAVPVLTLGGLLADPLAPALAQCATVAAALAADSRELPDSLAWGVRFGLDPGPAADGDPELSVGVALTLNRLSLIPDTAAVPVGAIEVQAQVHRPGGWLLNGTDNSGAPIRARSLHLRARVDPGAAPHTAVELRLVDVASGGSAAAYVTADDPLGAGLLTEVFARLDAAAAPGGQLATLLAALADLGVLRRGGEGGTALRADAVAALREDASGYLAPHLPALLDRTGGLLGLARNPGAAAGGGPWVLRSAGHPVELSVHRDPWRVTVRTVDDGLPIGAGATIALSGSVPLSGPAPDVSGGVDLGGLTVTRAPGGKLQLSAPWLPVPLPLPPDSGTAAASAAMVGRLLVDAALTLVAEQALGGTVRLTGLDRLVTDPAGWLATRLGEGSLPRAEDLRGLLRLLAQATGLAHDDARPLMLPGGLVVDVEEASGLLRLAIVATGIALPGLDGGTPTLSTDFHLDLDPGRTVSPGGQFTLHVPLPGDWHGLDLTCAVGASGLGVGVTLATTPPITVRLLPAPGGLEQLAGDAAQHLLPAVLDALSTALANRTPPPAALTDVLAVASALGVYDPAAAAGQRFAARSAQLEALVADLAAGNLTALGSAVATAITAVLGRLGIGAPANRPSGTVAVQLPGVLGGSLTAGVDLTSAPALQLELAGLGAGAVTAGLAVAASARAVTATATLAGSWDTGAGVVIAPQLRASYGSAGILEVALRPLGTDAVVIALAPQPAPPTAADLLLIGDAWLIPLAVTVGLRGAAAVLDRKLWADGPQVSEVLLATQLVTEADGKLSCKLPPPAPATIAAGVLQALTNLDIPLPGGLKARVLQDGSRYGVGVAGALPLPGEDVTAALHFGVPAAEDPGWGAGGGVVGVLFLDLTDPQSPTVVPVLVLGGLGVQVGGPARRALVDTDVLTLGDVSAHLRTEIPLSGDHALDPAGFDGAVRLDNLGLPLLGAIGSGGDKPDPVVGALLKPGPGDTTAANPSLDVSVATVNGVVHVKLDGIDDPAPHWVAIHRTFGPLHLEQIGLGHTTATTGPGTVDVHVDASVSVSALAIEPAGLRLSIPLNRPADAAHWAVGLDGLAVRLDLPVVHVAGGLLRALDEHGTVEYDGFLTVEVAGRGFTAIGAFSQPVDEQGGYTSLFVFVSLPFTLGGPPFLFVEGLAGGVGFNRGLVVPTDPLDAITFPLVQAVEQGGLGSGAEGPMAALKRFGTAVPARRGSYWVAAGLRFSTFALLHTTAIAYAALDGGFEIGVLGVTRMVLPLEGPRIVNVELALNARYSTRDQLLSVRAQLTDNSWVLSPDCQLTGGFAFMVWFQTGRFLFTIGGYAPPKMFDATGLPAVPRVGFRWAVSSTVSVKGGTYLALLPTCLMFGARLEVTFSAGPISVWFAAWFDVLLSWDPFRYALSVGITIGAAFDMKVCLIVCVHIRISVSLGATVELSGPPLHGYAHVDLAVASVTVPIGEEPTALPFLDWIGDNSFVRRYLTADGSTPVAAAQVAAGAVADKDSPGADGTAAHPWLVTPTWQLRTETRMPCGVGTLGGATVPLTATDGSARVQLPPTPLQPVPCGTKVAHVRAAHAVQIARVRPDGTTEDLTLPVALAEPEQGHFATTLWQDGAAASTDSLPALGGLSLTFAADPGTPAAERSLVGLVETAVSPLPVLTPTVAMSEAVDELKVSSSASARPAAGPSSPQLRVTLHRSSGWHPATALAATDAMPVGHWQIWDLPHDWDGGVAVDVAGGDRVRLTCLSGGGTVIADSTLNSSAAPTLPPGTRRVTTLPLRGGAEGPAGWHLGTRLLRAGPATALAEDAVLLLPGPVTPGQHRPGGLSVARAADLLRGWSSCTTLLPARTTTVAVLLDPATDTTTDVLVTIDGVPVQPTAADEATSAQLPVPPGGACRLYAVPARAGTDRHSVRVDTGAGWRLAGVLGLSDAAPAASIARAPAAATATTAATATATTLRWTGPDEEGSR
ncbi:MAG: DUF6603 domain-containing protein [Dermatophilaceae bacterium]